MKKLLCLLLACITLFCGCAGSSGPGNNNNGNDNTNPPIVTPDDGDDEDTPPTDPDVGGDGDQGETTPPDTGDGDGDQGETTPPDTGDGDQGVTTPPDTGDGDGDQGGTTPPDTGDGDGDQGGTTPPDTGDGDGDQGETTPPDTGDGDQGEDTDPPVDPFNPPTNPDNPDTGEDKPPVDPGEGEGPVDPFGPPVNPDNPDQGGEETPPEVTPAIEYELTLPTHSFGTVKANKTKYEAGEKVELKINPNKYYMVEEGSLKVNGTPITNNEFIMGEENANVTVNFIREDIPEGYIYGANFTGKGHWNMAMINFAKPVSLEGAESIIIEIRFNKSHSGQWIRPVVGTSDGTVYDSFVSGKEGATHKYLIDHDPYFATPVYNWEIREGGSLEATWNGYPTAPTYHIEIPLNEFFVKCNKIDWQPINEFEPLNQTKYLNKVGIHVTNENENDFTIGRTYIRKNGIVVKTTDPTNYSTSQVDGKDYVYPWKLDGTTSPLSVKLYQPTCEHIQPKMLVLGDSIMTTWWSYSMVRDIADKFNAELVRDTVGGTTIGSAKGTGLINHARQGLYKDYVDLYGEFDYVIIQRGTNDLWFDAYGTQENFMLGDENSVGLNTTFGSLKYIIEHLKEISPNVNIICTTLLYRNDDIPITTVENYNATLKKVANAYDVNLFDLYSLSGINANNYTTYLAPDKLHPNKDGATLLTGKWIEYLETVIKK